MIVKQNGDTLTIQSEGPPEETELINFIFNSIEDGSLYEICNGPKWQAMISECRKKAEQARHSREGGE